MAQIIFAILVALDQLSKWLTRRYLANGREIEIIPSFFKLQQARNKGAAWGFLSEHSWGIYVLTAISLIAAVFVLYLMLKVKGKMLRYTLAVLLAGAVGNLIDRLFFGEVVDFLAFQFGSYHFPNFNIADSAICLSAAFLIYLLLFRRQELHDLESLFTEDQDAKRA